MEEKKVDFGFAILDFGLLFYLSHLHPSQPITTNHKKALASLPGLGKHVHTTFGCLGRKTV
jgi:hypothetical protein